ncbi:hypothetical protein VP01_1510g2 [Puccinia sorghi]|uniref:Uncharacterized protein n=1 Tax=Puccinia sorghi TaxID=27349 RepID=A0A0L6VIZ1_9BASI|nr:hypothetical protein VP01_1510g2 [Puccinia sorghi]
MSPVISCLLIGPGEWACAYPHPTSIHEAYMAEMDFDQLPSQHALQKKLAQLPAVDMQKVPGSFCCYSNHPPKVIQPSFDAQSLCRLHNYLVELGWQLGWSMLHVNCRQLSKFFFAVKGPNLNQAMTNLITLETSLMGHENATIPPPVFMLLKFQIFHIAFFSISKCSSLLFLINARSVLSWGALKTLQKEISAENSVPATGGKLIQGTQEKSLKELEILMKQKPKKLSIVASQSHSISSSLELLQNFSKSFVGPCSFNVSTNTLTTTTKALSLLECYFILADSISTFAAPYFVLLDIKKEATVRNPLFHIFTTPKGEAMIACCLDKKISLTLELLIINTLLTIPMFEGGFLGSSGVIAVLYTVYRMAMCTHCPPFWGGDWNLFFSANSAISYTGGFFAALPSKIKQNKTKEMDKTCSYKSKYLGNEIQGVISYETSMSGMFTKKKNSLNFLKLNHCGKQDNSELKCLFSHVVTLFSHSRFLNISCFSPLCVRFSSSARCANLYNPQILLGINSFQVFSRHRLLLNITHGCQPQDLNLLPVVKLVVIPPHVLFFFVWWIGCLFSLVFPFSPPPLLSHFNPLGIYFIFLVLSSFVFFFLFCLFAEISPLVSSENFLLCSHSSPHHHSSQLFRCEPFISHVSLFHSHSHSLFHVVWFRFSSYLVHGIWWFLDVSCFSPLCSHLSPHHHFLRFWFSKIMHTPSPSIRILQPCFHPNSTFFICRCLGTATVHQSLVESLLENGFSNNRSFLGISTLVDITLWLENKPKTNWLRDTKLISYRPSLNYYWLLTQLLLFTHSIQTPHFQIKVISVSIKILLNLLMKRGVMEESLRRGRSKETVDCADYKIRRRKERKRRNEIRMVSVEELSSKSVVECGSERNELVKGETYLANFQCSVPSSTLREVSISMKGTLQGTSLQENHFCEGIWRLGKTPLYLYFNLVFTCKHHITPSQDYLKTCITTYLYIGIMTPCIIFTLGTTIFPFSMSIHICLEINPIRGSVYIQFLTSKRTDIIVRALVEIDEPLILKAFKASSKPNFNLHSRLSSRIMICMQCEINLTFSLTTSIVFQPPTLSINFLFWADLVSFPQTTVLNFCRFVLILYPTGHSILPLPYLPLLSHSTITNLHTISLQLNSKLQSSLQNQYNYRLQFAIELTFILITHFNSPLYCLLIFLFVFLYLLNNFAVNIPLIYLDLYFWFLVLAIKPLNTNRTHYNSFTVLLNHYEQQVMGSFICASQLPLQIVLGLYSDRQNYDGKISQSRTSDN